MCHEKLVRFLTLPAKLLALRHGPRGNLDDADWSAIRLHLPQRWGMVHCLDQRRYTQTTHVLPTLSDFAHGPHISLAQLPAGLRKPLDEGNDIDWIGV